ncbi:O-antigen ligase family protein [Chlorogloeopsis sp. ULAP01]|uniref:O-antigen ligase family protein n=1 Tax=Chlorogloeopsis sp. ULAP01 TaxID=3056483 RepID=UPI0025AA9D5C|nr:O-antigen ligase family protein [Chlorogloeopsis sp. ULAP01]MDM9381605.1 O-antigen ligase family protein [Chlorogloeopsis sp. ULAP01]
MLSDQTSSHSSRLALLVGLAGVGVGIVAGFLAGAKPLLLVLALIAVPTLIFFFARFEQAVLCLLILRSSLDVFSAQQIPAAFGIGFIFLTLLYVTVRLLIGKSVHTDGFWWFFAGWVMLQGLWVILLPVGGLGLDASFLPEAIREWVRLFSWAMVYLLVMQLKDRLPPEKVISSLFLALVIPIAVALMQMFLPSLLPPFLAAGDGRIKGTIGHPNAFVSFLLLFIGLTWWKLNQSRQRLPWLCLLGLLVLCYASTKSLFGLMMLSVFVLVLIAPRLSPITLIGGMLLIALVMGLFVSSEYGQHRISSIANTPLLNPDMDISRAILLSQGDMNSFNWRLAQWNLILNRWQHHPILGYGLGLSIPVAGNGAYPHNDYLRALIEGGIMGLVSFVIFLIAQGVRLVQLIYSAPRGSAKRNLCFIMLAIFFSMPVAMVTENIWSQTPTFFYWWSVFAVAGWNWNETQTLEHSVSTSKFFRR